VITVNFKHVCVRVTKELPEADIFEYEIRGKFQDVVPLDSDTPCEKAAFLHGKVKGAVQTRLGVFGELLNLVLREGKLQHWQEVDVALTALAVLLERGGLDGAINAIKPEVEGTQGTAGGDGSMY